MSVKYINCYGTSFTQGGGFEYWRFNGIKIAYRGLSPMIANTHWEFSWPCQLQKFVGNDMQYETMKSVDLVMKEYIGKHTK